MKKQVFGRQFKRDSNERKALFRSLMSELVLHERIETTEQKAKAIKGSVDKLVTKVKRKGLNARVLVSPYLTTDATEKLLTDVAIRFEKRPGGYTRIIRLDKRLSDKASMVVMEWVEKKSVVLEGVKVGTGKKIDEVMADVVYGKEKDKAKKPVKTKIKKVVAKEKKK